MRVVLARSSRIDLPDGSSVYAWKDKSGLCIATNVDATRELKCMTPFVVGESRVQARTVEIEETNECPWCDLYVAEVVDSDGNPLYPLRFHPGDIAMTRPFVEHPANFIFAITAFGLDVEIHSDRDSLFAAHPESVIDVLGDTVRLLGPETLIQASTNPAGEIESTAEVYMTATVLSAKKRQNGITGVSHVQCLARTSGAVFDVILAGDAKPSEVPRPGTILDGTFVLTGVLVSK